MRGIVLTACLVIFTNIWAVGEGESNDTTVTDVSYKDALAEAEQFMNRLDDKVSGWYSDRAFSYIDTAFNDSTSIANVPDSVFIQRLKKLSEETVIELPFNERVKAHIAVYTDKKRAVTSEILGLTDYYFPIFEEELDKAGLPIELKYMPVIESALKPRAFSRAGASGLWQFVYYTGKQYHLNVNSYVDERRDPRKSTQAAIKYLSDLYDIYQDWYLVIAAYNCGPGNVNKAIRRSGGKRDYWEIYYRLPRETRGYVPAFIGAMYALNYYKEHHIIPVKANIPMHTDTLIIQEPLHFDQVSAVLNVPEEVLKELNPQYRRDIIPGGSKSYTLTVPVSVTGQFVELQDSIFNYKDDIYFSEKRETVDPTASSGYVPSSIAGKTKLYYTVKSGDNLGYIADWYDVRISDLRYWNNIYRNLIRVGQRLVVFVPTSQKNKYVSINQMSFAQKQGTASYTASTAPVQTTTGHDPDYIYYKVRSGDNLWLIARKFPGISSDDIKRLNNLTSNSISPGQLLKIKPKG
ncbi:transglycosylase SLT domain-containing protein [Saccharicrinis sp. FJH2]|uniref:lytic transglycosylase domain-containing protein n=1 Tax=Saccharicrinis sp. FJH65 TaxID=3344659 RepID=UPI0035F27092